MTGSTAEGGAPSHGPPDDPEQDWPSEHVAAFFAERMVLQQVTSGISDAVRVQAANPLLHVAAFLRQPPPCVRGRDTIPPRDLSKITPAETPKSFN